MGDEHPVDRSTQLAQERTDLALQRTIIAAERTLMAWIRTSVSLIGFGFTIYKFLQYLRESVGLEAVRRASAPHNLGLAFIALGTVALIGAIWENREFMRRIGASHLAPLWSTAIIVAVLVVLIGVAAFVGVLLRAGPF